ncbi:MAG: molybdenum cofactor guanylyltransferase [Actinomycetota bacterium]|nr:molybdenum cofactor guanylyltransferase [Actinomycetota bacterium]
MQSKSASVIILSGGTSTRFGSDKSAALIGGESLIARILRSIPKGFEIIIVGPDPNIYSSQYLCVVEKPMGGGPVAALKAGLDIAASHMVALIATDMPFAPPRVINLLNYMRAHDDAVMYVDDKGFKQPLAALYRVESLERAFAEMGEVDGKSMKELISHLRVQEVLMSDEVARALLDIDTQADLDRAIAFDAQVADNEAL